MAVKPADLWTSGAFNLLHDQPDLTNWLGRPSLEH